MSRQRPLQNESTACGQKLKQQGKMRSGAPEHLLRLAIWLRERPNICCKVARTFRAHPTTCCTLQQHFGHTEASLQGASAFLACQKHGVRRKNDKIRVEKHE